MKKNLLFVISAILISTSALAKELIPLTASLNIDDKTISLGNGYGKGPDAIPFVYIEDYTLSFEVSHPDYLLNIKDEDGNVVFSTVVWSAQTEVVLPSTLSGDYEIELVMGNWLFSGWINL